VTTIRREPPPVKAIIRTYSVEYDAELIELGSPPWLVVDEEGQPYDYLATEAEARASAEQLAREDRDEHARDVFTEDLDALKDQLHDMTADQIRVVKLTMADALRQVREEP
jgi:hypothetical protein